jgi:hypothetical protein
MNTAILSGVRIIRGVAAAAIFVCAALGLAGPANADQVIEGVYNYVPSDGQPGTWTIMPSCVPVVGDLRVPLELPVACRLHVVASKGTPGGDAYLTNGVWTIQTNDPQGMRCPDGTWAPTTGTVTFDDATLTGTRTVFHNDDCGLQPGKIDQSFTLSLRGPLPMPVERYPLDCEPAGLRICR